MNPHVSTTQPPSRFVYVPIMLAWIGRKKGGAVTFYSHELRNSLSQVVNRGVLPHIDFDYGFQSLQNLIEDKFKGQYNVARIYAVQKDNLDKGSILMEYRNDKLVIDNPPDFSNPKLIALKERVINRIQEGIHRSDEVYEISNLKRNLKVKR